MQPFAVMFVMTGISPTGNLQALNLLLPAATDPARMTPLIHRSYSQNFYELTSQR